MFYEVSLGMYGAYTIVTLGVFLPKVPLVYHGVSVAFWAHNMHTFKVQV